MKRFTLKLFRFLCVLFFANSVFSREISIEKIAELELRNPAYFQIDENGRIFVCSSEYALVLNNQLKVWTVLVPSYSGCLGSLCLKNKDFNKIVVSIADERTGSSNLNIYDSIGNYIKTIPCSKRIDQLFQVSENIVASIYWIDVFHKGLALFNIDTNQVFNHDFECNINFFIVDSKNPSKNIILGLSNGQIQWWSLNGELLKSIYLDLNFSPFKTMSSFDNLLFVSSLNRQAWRQGQRKGQLQVFDITNGEEKEPFDYEGLVTYMDKSQDHQKILTSCGGDVDGGQICIWDLSSKKLIKSFRVGTQQHVSFTKFIRDSNFLISLVYDNSTSTSKIILWDQLGNEIYSLDIGDLTYLLWEAPDLKFISKDTFVLSSMSKIQEFKISGLNGKL